MRTLILCLGVAVAVLSACLDEQMPALPVPQLVQKSDLPPPDETVDYYNILKADRQKWEQGAEPVLRDLAHAGFDVLEAWYPAAFTTCVKPTATATMIVRLRRPSSRILEFGLTGGLKHGTRSTAKSSRSSITPLSDRQPAPDKPFTAICMHVPAVDDPVRTSAFPVECRLLFGILGHALVAGHAEPPQDD
jgi:hypothetical protein